MHQHEPVCVFPHTNHVLLLDRRASQGDMVSIWEKKSFRRFSQAVGSTPFDPKKADVWSLGITLFAIVIGEDQRVHRKLLRFILIIVLLFTTEGCGLENGASIIS